MAVEMSEVADKNALAIKNDSDAQFVCETRASLDVVWPTIPFLTELVCEFARPVHFCHVFNPATRLCGPGMSSKDVAVSRKSTQRGFVSSDWVDMRSIWKEDLLPHIEEPAVERALSRLVESKLAAPARTALAQATRKRRASSNAGEQETMLSMERPWLSFPLPLLAQAADATLRQDEFADLMRRATSRRDPEWWCWSHECWDLNGDFLLTLLRVAYPARTFRVAQTLAHAWVVDERGCNYDLYWSLLGLPLSGAFCYSSVREALALPSESTFLSDADAVCSLSDSRPPLQFIMHAS